MVLRWLYLPVLLWEEHTAAILYASNWSEAIFYSLFGHVWNLLNISLDINLIENFCWEMDCNTICTVYPQWIGLKKHISQVGTWSAGSVSAFFFFHCGWVSGHSYVNSWGGASYKMAWTWHMVIDVGCTVDSNSNTYAKINIWQASSVRS